MEAFINYLKSKEMSQNTISSYSYAVSQFLSRYTTVNDESLLSHKDWLVSEFATKTANNRIGALNCYLRSHRLRWDEVAGRSRSAEAFSR